MLVLQFQRWNIVRFQRPPHFVYRLPRRSNVGQISIFIQSRPGAACRAWWGLCVMVLIILLLFCCNATAQIIRLPKVVPKVGTNLCHITVDFDRVPEAQWYAVIVRWDSNRAEIKRIYSMTNHV